MSFSEATAIGLTLMGISGISYAFLRTLLRTLPGNSSRSVFYQAQSDEPESLENREAVLVIEPGGRVAYINQRARELFKLGNKPPNLENLARAIQPGEAFLELCAGSPVDLLTFRGELLTGHTARIPYSNSEATVVILHPLAPDTEIAIKELTQQLESRVAERTRALNLEHKRTETLLRILIESTSSLDLERLLHRTLQALNEVIGASHATCMVFKNGDRKLRHLATIGYPHPTPVGGQPSALNIDQGLVGWIIRNKEPVLIADVLEDERWLVIPETEFKHRSAMGVPLILGENILGVLLLFHPEVGYFSRNQLDLVRAAASQMAVAINNAELFALTREQADELRILLSNQQVETSRTRSILESIAEGVIVTDQENRVTLYNESAHHIFKLEPAQVLGQDLNHFSELFENTIHTWIETILTWSKDPYACEAGETYSEQLSLRDGRILAVNLAPVLSQGKFYGTVSIFHDITHQIEVDRLKSEFVATVSHELRTPMTAIKGFVDILLIGAAGSLNPQQKRFLDIVKGNTERLTILVNDLLDLSRIEAGKVILSIQPLDLRAILEESLDDLRRRSKEDGKTLEYILHCPDELPDVRGDPEKVRQILSNLLNNAYHYTPPAGRVIVSARSFGREVQVDIADTGVGIPLTEQDRVFERFYRGENPLVLSTAGTGLGLSIVQQLIHMHQGRIWLRSSGVPGEGSVFSFTLPVFSPADQPGQEGKNGENPGR